MEKSMFQKASRKRSKLRMAIMGPSGSGKTMSALKIARGLVGPEGRIAVIDTERGSASLYEDVTAFDVCELTSFSVENYIAAIKGAIAAGYDVVVIDSLSHAWAGKDGLLEFVDNQKRASKNDFSAWRNATPLHNQLVDTILQAPVHVLVTMRSKVEYIIEKNERGQSVPRKVGMQPVQRDGLDYEFTVVGDMDHDNTLTITKSRCSPLQGKCFLKPNGEVSAILREWLDSGAEPAPAQAPQFTQQAQAAPSADPALKAQWERAKAICAEHGATKTEVGAWLREQGIDPKTVTATALTNALSRLEAQYRGETQEEPPAPEPEPAFPELEPDFEPQPELDASLAF